MKSFPIYRKIKNIAFEFLQILDIYPRISFSRNPFKIFEFQELTRGLVKTKESIFLDIGSGFGLQTILLAKWAGKVIGIDPFLTEEAISLHKRYNNVEFLKSAIEDVNFPDGFFDAIFSFSVLEHIPNYYEALKQSFSLLKPGGRLFLSCDSLESIKSTATIQKHREDHKVHVYFRKGELEKILSEIGFENIELYPIFRSAYARDLFIDGIWKGFDYGYLEALLKHRKLRAMESQDFLPSKGLFQIAKITKPS